MRPKPKASSKSCKAENRRMDRHPNRNEDVCSTSAHVNHGGHIVVGSVREVVAEGEQNRRSAQEDELRSGRAILIPYPGDDGQCKAMLVKRHLVLVLSPVSV